MTTAMDRPRAHRINLEMLEEISKHDDVDEIKGTHITRVLHPLDHHLKELTMMNIGKAKI